jgi:beta-lactamase regulating signal transducer with metallopeptidase domain
LEILLRLTTVLLAVMIVVLVLRRASAALRHWICALSLVGALLLPCFYGFLPAWQWSILPPQPSAAPAMADEATPPVELAASPSPTDAPEAGEFVAIPPLPVEEPFSEVPPHEVAPPVSTQGHNSQVVTLPPAVLKSGWSAETWSVFLLSLWAIGSGLCLVWLAIGIGGAWSIVREAQPVEDSSWSRLLRQLVPTCKLRRPVTIRMSSRISVPMTWGVRRPVILVPAGSESWSEQTKRSVLLHELAHIRRGDCFTHLLGRLACAVYWFHPLVWLVARQLCKTSEQAADDMVLAADTAPPDYAEHLVQVARQAKRFRLIGSVALPMASPSDLEKRVRAILDSRRSHRRLKRKTIYVLAVFALLILVPGALLQLGYAQEKKPGPSKTVSKTLGEPISKPKPEESASEENQAKPTDAAEPTKPTEPTLRPLSDRPAPKELLDKILKSNRHWLRPDPEYLSYTFTMKFLKLKRDFPNGSPVTYKVEYQAPDRLRIQKGEELLYPFKEEEGKFDPRKMFPKNVAIMQAVTMMGPLQHWATVDVSEYCKITMAGEEKLDGVDAWVLQLRPATITETKDYMPIQVGCGIYSTWYGSGGQAAGVDQVWVDKTTGRILREEAFYKDKPTFVTTYSDYQKTSDGGQVPGRIVVRLLKEKMPEVFPWVFDMKFQLVDQKVWLLKELYESQGTRGKMATARVTDVRTSPPQDKPEASSTTLPKMNHTYEPLPNDEKLTEELQLYCRWDAAVFGVPNAKYWDRLSPEKRTEEENYYLRLILSKNESERVRAIDALAGLRSKKAIPFILQIAADRKEKNNWDRHTATRALGLLGDKSVVPELVHLTYHYNWNTRLWARISLLRLTGQNFGHDVEAWKTWWEKQDGRPPIVDETIQWATSTRILRELKGYPTPQLLDERDREMIPKMKKMLERRSLLKSTPEPEEPDEK